MPPIRDAIRYAAKRVLLQRTRLAYVHLRNLLTDAKRDRSARVSGYVAVWMPEELLVLYLEEGEVVTATASTDGQRFVPMAISEAIGHVPTAAEYGSICFHEATDEQVDLMYATQTGEPVALPRELVPGDAAAPPVVRLWGAPAPLPHQASPALIQSYRELIGALTARLREAGKPSAAEVTEGARRALVLEHPTLERFSPSLPTTKDPVTAAQTLTKAIASWTADILWAACPDDTTPEELLRDLAGSRRHVFQAAGLFDALPWKVQW